MEIALTLTLRLLPRNTTGFVAVDPVGLGGKGLIVMSFRGSEFTRARTSDLATNNDAFTQVPASLYCFNCTAARGYFESYMSVNRTVVESVKAQLNITGQQNYQVVATGHSLGGALATFAALELRRLNISVHLVSRHFRSMSIYSH
jgi:pimeloyl-ACP methyl ester carboxylesterase